MNNISVKIESIVKHVFYVTNFYSDVGQPLLVTLILDLKDFTILL